MFRYLVLSIALFAASACSKEPISDLASANNRFAVALLHELSQSEPGNIIVSPYSLETALCMAYAGARGETAKQMADVLEIRSLGDSVHALQYSLANALRTTCNTDTVAKLTIANATWSAGCSPMPTYTDLVKRDYNAESRALKSSPSKNARLINSWAAEHTEKRITQVVTPEMLSKQLGLVITNAVYFLGRWQYPFESRQTQSREFWLSPDKSISVPTMKQDLPARGPRYLKRDTFQALELPYKQSTAALVIFLPQDKNGLTSLESEVTGDWLAQQIESMQAPELEVDLTLPKVSTQGNSSMNDALRTLGMPLAFQGGRADFSGICPSRGDLFIQDVVHATFFKMDERGTEAAAVTALMMGLTSVPIRHEKIVFHADHPFFFLIRDTATNTILFMGHIVDPRK